MGRFHIKAGMRLLGVAALLGSVLLSACTPAIPTEQAEQQLVAFMLGYLLHGPGSAGPVTGTGVRHWAEAPANASIIVWAPPVVPLKNDGIEYVQSDQPLKVWWYADEQLVEVIDKQVAIREYRAAHLPGTSPARYGSTYYEFGILSLSQGNRQARVYAASTCGPLCGSGSIYTLERSEAGTWEVTHSEMRWIS